MQVLPFHLVSILVMELGLVTFTVKFGVKKTCPIVGITVLPVHHLQAGFVQIKRQMPLFWPLSQSGLADSKAHAAFIGLKQHVSNELKYHLTSG